MSAIDDPRVKAHVRAAAREIRASFGITNIGGFASSGHIPNSDHYKGLALDVMGAMTGQRVADWAQANAQRLGVTYIIWNRRIWDSRNDRGWVRYTGANPHTGHVHISFHPTAKGGGSAPQSPVDYARSTGQKEPSGCLAILAQLFGPNF